jgi:hypothetical protein
MQPEEVPRRIQTIQSVSFQNRQFLSEAAQWFFQMMGLLLMGLRNSFASLPCSAREQANHAVLTTGITFTSRSIGCIFQCKAVSLILFLWAQLFLLLRTTLSTPVGCLLEVATVMQQDRPFEVRP